MSSRRHQYMWGATIGFALVCSPAVAGDSYWSQRARDVAAARLSATDTTASPAVSTEAAARAVPVTRTGGFHLSAVELDSYRLAADSAASRPANEGKTNRTESSEKSGEPAIERGPLPGFFDTVKRDLKEAPGLLWHDTKKVYTNPWNLAFLVGAGGVSVALRPEADDDIEDHFDKHHTFPKGERNTFDALGNPATGAIMAGTWYLAGQVLQDAKTYEVGKRMASALIITDLSTVLLKVSANTDSPNGEPLAWPSGHMSSTMAVATVLYDAYGPLVGVPAYGAATFVGIQRLDGRDHSLSDVVFGAALGWTVAHTVMKEHAPEICGGEIVPYIDPVHQGSGIAWVKSLGNDPARR